MNGSLGATVFGSVIPEKDAEADEAAASAVARIEKRMVGRLRRTIGSLDLERDLSWMEDIKGLDNRAVLVGDIVDATQRT